MLTTHKSQLGFDLPVINKNLEKKLDLSPKAMQDWCAKLPMTQTGYVAKEIHFAVIEILQTELKTEALFDILEILQPSVQWVCQGLKKYYANQNNLLNEEQLTIINLGQTLQANIMMGYKQIINALFSQNYNNKDLSIQNRLIVAIFRTLAYARSILIGNYQLYAVASPNFWREIYIIYNFANKHELLTATHPQDKEQSILVAFKMMFLLVATNPYQWRQLEQELINAAIYNWERFVKLRFAEEDDFIKPGIFVADLQLDAPPEPSMLKKVNFSKDCIAVDLTTLAKHLREILDEMHLHGIKVKQQHERDPEFNIPLNSLKILCAQWATPIVRKEERIKAEGEIEAVFGYAAVHYFTNNRLDFDLKKLDTVFTKTSTKKITNITLSSDKKSDKPNKQHICYQCKLLDVSSKGSLVLWHGEIDPEMSPGHIIGFRSKDALSITPWMLGAIAWIKRINKNDLMMGLEHLNLCGKAVALQMEKNGEGIGSVQLGFLLPKIDKLDKQPTIITPIVPFKEGIIVKVILHADDQKEAMTIELEQQVFETRSFRQFEFKILKINEEIVGNIEIKKFITDSESTNQVKGLFSDKHDSKFDNLWNNLE